MQCISTKKLIMNRDTILQSNLLDIIFENRNKDYGAYTLRKEYDMRLRFAFFSMIGISIIFSLFFLSKSSTKVFTQSPLTIFTRDKTLSDFQLKSNSGHKSVEKVINHLKKNTDIKRPPKITPSDNINNLTATQSKIHPSFAKTDNSEIDFPSNEDGSGNGSLNGKAIIPALTISPKPERTKPVEEAEIMPQYPGGIKALLAFLKENLHSPGDVEEGEDVSVRIKFVVNYNGKLESFQVIKSGGEAFDNEVLRVLKKMPLWIPGKSNGENVSVYYLVPVKFTSEF